jgi:hypothetical protein
MPALSVLEIALMSGRKGKGAKSAVLTLDG